MTQTATLALPDGTSTDIEAKGVRVASPQAGQAWLVIVAPTAIARLKLGDVKMGFEYNVSIDRFLPAASPLLAA